jgi:hypothetical protein
MYLDAENLISDDQTVAHAAGSVSLTNVIDLQKLGIGKGNPVKLFCQFTEALASANSTGTCTIYLAGGTTASLGTALFNTAALAPATAVLGYRPPQLNITLPPDCPRFIGGTYTIGTETTTAGKITFGVVIDDQSNSDPVALSLTS